MKKVILSWSGGKDASYALYLLQQSNNFEVVGLLSTINGNLKRLSMHGVPENMIKKQAEYLNLPLHIIYVYEASNAEYESAMKNFLLYQKKLGITTIAFGDIFLEDLRKYREEKMTSIGMKTIFPLWKKNTKELIKEMIEKGFKTMTCCVQETKPGKDFLGRIIDEDFVATLPVDVDPCGENGEYHSYCFDGPIYEKPILIQSGEIVRKTYQFVNENSENCESAFWYIDIQPLNC